MIDAIVVGAGPSGLAVARELAQRGARVEVFEKTSGYGGDARSSRVDGFICDHSFLPFSRLSMARHLEVERLDLRALDMGVVANGCTYAGAAIEHEGVSLLEWFALFTSADETWGSSIAARGIRRRDVSVNPDISSTNYLHESRKEAAFQVHDDDAQQDDRLFEDVVRPLYVTATGEALGTTPRNLANSRVLDLLLDAWIPAQGNDQILEALASGLAIHPRREVLDIVQHGRPVVITKDGQYECKFVVTATGSHSPTDDRAMRSTFWFAAPEPPTGSRRIHLGSGVIGHLSHAIVVSNIAPERAPYGALIAATSVSRPCELLDLQSVLTEIARFCGWSTRGWRLLVRSDQPSACPTDPGIDATPLWRKDMDVYHLKSTTIADSLSGAADLADSLSAAYFTHSWWSDVLRGMRTLARVRRADREQDRRFKIEREGPSDINRK